MKQSHVKLDDILKACTCRPSGKNSNDSAASSNKIRTLEDKISKQESEIYTLKTRIQTITISHESSTLCNKNKYELDVAILESKLENTSQQFVEFKLQHSKSPDNYRHDVDILENILRLKNEELLNLESVCSNLRTEIEQNKSEILSLKMHNSRSNDLNDTDQKSSLPTRRTPSLTRRHLQYSRH